jgi:hypothetical protein
MHGYDIKSFVDPLKIVFNETKTKLIITLMNYQTSTQLNWLIQLIFYNPLLMIIIMKDRKGFFFIKAKI